MANRETAGRNHARRCCSRPMPAASFRWRRAPKTRRCIGSSRTSAASCRSNTSTCPPGSPAPSAPIVSAFASTTTSMRVLDGCAEPRAGPDADLDQWAHPHALPQALRHRPLPQRGGLRGRRAGRRSLRRFARARVLRRKHVPSRARRVEGCAGASGGAAQRRRLSAARHAVRHRSPEDFRRDRSAETRSITSCWRRRWSARPISALLPTGHGLTGAEALRLACHSASKAEPRRYRAVPGGGSGCDRAAAARRGCCGWRCCWRALRLRGRRRRLLRRFRGHRRRRAPLQSVSQMS